MVRTSIRAVISRRVEAALRTTLPVGFVLTALAGCGGASRAATHAERPPVTTLSCAQRSEGHFRGGYGIDDNLVVGRLALIGAGTPAREADAQNVRRIGGVKIPLILRNGSAATITIGAAARSFARLSYGHADRQTPLAKLPGSIRLRACQRHQRSMSDAGGRPVTFWSGFIMLGGAPTCVPLEITVDRHRTTRTVRIATISCP